MPKSHFKEGEGPLEVEARKKCIPGMGASQCKDKEIRDDLVNEERQADSQSFRGRETSQKAEKVVETQVR